jgi:hypothetical protein
MKIVGSLKFLKQSITTGCYLILIFFKEPEQKLFFYLGVLEEL